jgi:hypothetical protein
VSIAICYLFVVAAIRIEEPMRHTLNSPHLAFIGHGDP